MSTNDGNVVGLPHIKHLNTYLDFFNLAILVLRVFFFFFVEYFFFGLNAFEKWKRGRQNAYVEPKIKAINDAWEKSTGNAELQIEFAWDSEKIDEMEMSRGRHAVIDKTDLLEFIFDI